MMNNKRYLIFILLCLSLSSYGQDTYRSFFLDGKLGYSNFNNRSMSFTSDLGLGYFISRSHKVSLAPIFRRSRQSNYTNGQIEESKNSSFGFRGSYEYLHWFNNQTALGVELGVRSLDKEWFVPLSLNLTHRVTDKIDLGLRIGSMNIYQNNSYSSTDFDGIDPFSNIDYDTFVTDFESVDIPSKLFTNFSIVYRFKPDNKIETRSVKLDSIKSRNFSVGLSVRSSKVSTEYYKDDQLIDEIESKSTAVSLNFLMNPLGRIAYGGEVGIRKNKFSDFSDFTSFQIAPEVKYNWFYNSGFGMYAKGGLEFGFEDIEREGFAENISFMPSIESGIQYIIKDRVLYELTLVRASYYYRKLDFSKTYSFNTSLFSNPGLGVSVMW